MATLQDIRNAIDFRPVSVSRPQSEQARSMVPELLATIRRELKEALASNDPRELHDIDNPLSKLFIIEQVAPNPELRDMGFRRVRQEDQDDRLARTFFDDVLTRIDFSQPDDLNFPGGFGAELTTTRGGSARLEGGVRLTDDEESRIDALLTRQLSSAFPTPGSPSADNRGGELLLLGAGLILILILVAVVV